MTLSRHYPVFSWCFQILSNILSCFLLYLIWKNISDAYYDLQMTLNVKYWRLNSFMKIKNFKGNVFSSAKNRCEIMKFTTLFNHSFNETPCIQKFEGIVCHVEYADSSLLNLNLQYILQTKYYFLFFFLIFYFTKKYILSTNNKKNFMIKVASKA